MANKEGLCKERGHAFEKKEFMQVVRSSTPPVPLLESSSVRAVKPVTSAIMTAPCKVVMVGTMDLQHSRRPNQANSPG
jgi:hypothetical protein